jgi:acetyl/propionyl-CoA carboxylase alpha subunit
MIAKVIAHGPNRDGALTTLAGALRDTVLWPVKTNAGFLVKALGHPDFATAGRLDTGFIGREGGALMPSPLPGAVAAGDSVRKGQKLVTLEAMKMEHNLLAPFDGTISELNAREGGQVGAGTVVARIA